jgi:hypothetical protein
METQSQWDSAINSDQTLQGGFNEVDQGKGGQEGVIMPVPPSPEGLPAPYGGGGREGCRKKSPGNEKVGLKSLLTAEHTSLKL